MTYLNVGRGFLGAWLVCLGCGGFCSVLATGEWSFPTGGWAAGYQLETSAGPGLPAAGDGGLRRPYATPPDRPHPVERMLDAGEYTLALAAISALAPGPLPDPLVGSLTGSTAGGVANEALSDSLGSDRLRAYVLAHQRAHRSLGSTSIRAPGGRAGGDDQGSGTRSGDVPTGRSGREPTGRAGGMMQADFTSLINLIQTTVDPNSWEENGGTGIISTFPNGVMIDVAGQLSFPAAKPHQAERSSGLLPDPVNWVDAVSQRSVSLPKLEAALQRLAAEGQAIPESLSYLGGMYEVRSVAVDPTSGDLLLIGPAGPWEISPQGVAVNRETGRPVLHLDDLVACLRNVFHGRGVLGCSIDPRPGQFQRAAELAAKWNLTVPQVREKFLTAVGPQDTLVFGVPKTSHAAQVLLTADYHIKLLAMGSVKAGPGLPSYLDRCGADDPPSEIIRWWFTLAEPVISHNDDQTVYFLQGPYMELKTEAQLLAGRAAAGPPPPRSLAAESFVRDFNRQLPQWRRSFPVYGQLEHLFQWAVVAQLIKAQNLTAQAGWEPTFLVGQTPDTVRYALRQYPEIKEVQLVVNHRTLNVRDPVPADRSAVGRLKRQTIVAISGGVEIELPADRIRAVLQPRTPDSYSVDMVRGLEKSRQRLAPRPVGPAGGAASWATSLWYAD